jgi:hypothetical protein
MRKGIAVGIVAVVALITVVSGIVLVLHHPTNSFVSAPAESTPASIPDYTSKLPPKPDNFRLVMREIQSKYMDLCKLNESYYLQPEFYEESWQIGKRYYENHDYSRWVVHGHGAYPANPRVVFYTSEPGEWIRFCTFYRTGWSVETWQGLKLVPEQSEHFDVIIEPDEFLLPPTFPTFPLDWVKKLNITVKIKKKPPAGTYTLDVFVVNPSEENSYKWFWEVFERDITPEQIQMLEYCKAQQNATGNMNLQCQEWIELMRRNKYVEAGNIQVGSRLTTEIIVQ